MAYFNEEQKIRFIKKKDEATFTTSYHERQFNKSAEYEAELGKDLSNWTVYEILEYYKMLNFSSLSSVDILNSLFSDYTQFCLENSLVKDGQNHFLEITIELKNSCLNKMIKNRKILDREMLLDLVDQLPNPKDQFIIISLFEYGKSNDFRDMSNAKPEDVIGNILRLSNREVKISDKLLEIIEACKIEDKYYSITGKNTSEMPLIDDGHIIKKYPNNVSSNARRNGRNIYVACKRIFEFLDISWLTPNDITTSGKIHMIRTRSKELEITAKEYIYKYINEVENQYDSKIIKNRFLTEYESYL